MFCGSLAGDFLPIQVIYHDKTERCHPHYEFPSNWNITHASNHWSNEKTMIEYVTSIIVPYVQSTRSRFNPDTAAVVIVDNFKGQITPAVTELLESQNIHTCLLPPNTTDLLQPLDLSVNKPAKDFLRQCFEEWYSKEVTKQFDTDQSAIEPVNLRLPVLNALGAK